MYAGQRVHFTLYVRIGLHIRWHKPTRIYASGYTYIRIASHVRTCKSIPPAIWCLPHKRMFKGFVFPLNIAVDEISLAAKKIKMFLKKFVVFLKKLLFFF